MWLECPAFRPPIMRAHPPVEVPGQPGDGVFVADVCFPKTPSRQSPQLTTRLDEKCRPAKPPRRITRDDATRGAAINANVDGYNGLRLRRSARLGMEGGRKR